MSIKIQTYMGEVFTADSWDDLVGQLKLTNFSQPKDRQELMERVAWRIKQWQGEGIQFGTYEDFIRELDRVGFLTIIDKSPEGRDGR
jgi:hypothetical protein